MKSFASLHLTPSSNLLQAASTTLRALENVNIQSVISFFLNKCNNKAKSWQHSDVDDAKTDENDIYVWSWWILRDV